MAGSFNDFRFGTLNYRKQSRGYITMDRISFDKKKIVVQVPDERLLRTKYGYALILNMVNVCFIKDWQVNISPFGNEVLLDKDYFKPQRFGSFNEFNDLPDDAYMTWNEWLDIAKEQEKTDEQGFSFLPVHWCVKKAV